MIDKITNISEIPERWVILKISNIYKVFGTWTGGYLGSDRWKLNSGIENVEEDDEYYYFIGFSGSCYKCHKKGYGTITSYGNYILNDIIKKGNGQIKLMDNVDNWINVIKMNKEEIIEYGISVFEKESIFLDWLMTPNKSLNGLIPYELLNNEDNYKILTDILQKIEQNIYS